MGQWPQYNSLLTFLMFSVSTLLNYLNSDMFWIIFLYLLATLYHLIYPLLKRRFWEVDCLVEFVNFTVCSNTTGFEIQDPKTLNCANFVNGLVNCNIPTWDWLDSWLWRVPRRPGRTRTPWRARPRRSPASCPGSCGWRRPRPAAAAPGSWSAEHPARLSPSTCRSWSPGCRFWCTLTYIIKIHNINGC